MVPMPSAAHPSTEPERVLTTSEVAGLFRVNVHTVSRWADRGLLSSFRTPGGHRRYLASEVHALRAKNFAPIRE